MIRRWIPKKKHTQTCWWMHCYACESGRVCVHCAMWLVTGLLACVARWAIIHSKHVYVWCSNVSWISVFVSFPKRKKKFKLLFRCVHTNEHDCAALMHAKGTCSDNGIVLLLFPFAQTRTTNLRHWFAEFSFTNKGHVLVSILPTIRQFSCHKQIWFCVDANVSVHTIECSGAAIANIG